MIDIAGLNIKIDSSDAKTAKNDLDNLRSSGKTVESQMGSMSKTAIKLGASLAAAFSFQQIISRGLTAFSDLDKGLIGVQKTTGLADAEIKVLDSSISKISLTVPVSTKRLLELAEAAGQLGVKGRRNIETFTETMAKLETATDVTGEEGAKSIARLLNVTNEAISTVPRFGSVLVALGNNSAASEKEILSLATEIGQATSVFSVSAADAAALGAAMASMGVRAELGGSVIGRAMREIESAIMSGGEQMKQLMSVTKMTEDQLTKTFKTNATLVFKAWIDGVGDLVNSGQSAASVLEQFNLKGEEVLKVLPTMAENNHLLADALKISNAEVENATALNKESMAATKSFSAQLLIAMNHVDLIAASIGKGLAPVIIDILDDFRDWVDVNEELIAQGIPAMVGETADKAKQLQPVVKLIAETLGVMAEGFLSMPASVQTGGLIGAFLGGKYGMAIVAGVSFLTAELSDLYDGLNALKSGGISMSDFIGSEKDFEAALKKYRDLKTAAEGSASDLSTITAQVAIVKAEYNKLLATPMSTMYKGEVEERIKSLDSLKTKIAELEKQEKELAYSSRNQTDWKAQRDLMVSTFGKAKEEESAIESKANATSISGHKSVTASHNKELEEQVRAFEQAKEEQKRALESFNDDYKKVFLSTFDYEIAKLDEKYEYFKAQKVDELKLEEWYAEEYFRINQEDIARFMDQQEKAKEEQKRALESFNEDYKNATLSTFGLEIAKLDEKYEYYKAQKIDELRLEEWYAEEKLRIQNEADKEAKEAQQDAYDELYDGIYGFTRNVIDDWDDMGNTLVDMAESMVKDIIAAFVTQKIAIPIYMYAADMAGISTGLASGMSPSSGGLASMTSPISSLFTIGKTAYTLVTEGVSAAVSDLVGADLLGSISSAMFGETAATAAALDFTTISPTVASTIESAYAVANGGAATTTSAASGLGAASAAGLAVAAFMAIDTFLGSHDQADPDLYVQSPIGGLTESTATYTVSNRDAVTDEIVTIFDAAFASLDESLDANIVDAVTASAFRGKARITDLDETDANALINALVESAFSGDYTGSIASFEGLFGAGSGTGYKTVTVDGEDTEYWNNILTPLTEAVSGQYSKGLSDILMEAIGLNSDIFDFDFLKSLQAEGENLFDTFANFAIVVQETDGFVENITRQIDEFGFTVEEAFANILVVISVLDEIQASVDALATTSSVAALNTLTDSWYALIDSLEAAYATTTQITEAETAMAQVLGANITGLTADALQSALSEGSDIESILQTSIQNAAYADIAQKIAEEYISGINEQIGQVWIDTGGDLEAVAEAMQDIDTTEAQAALEELQESFGLLAESTNDALDTAEAMRIVTLAIEGQLSTSQKFEEWQISNIEAMNLFSEIVADSVTADELEGAVDAFAALGIEGDDLNNVIQNLADTFTEATQQMYENISNIESAQNDLIGADDTTQEYLNAMADVVDFFKDTPSLAQIRGDESITTTTFDEDAYREAIADAVVNSEYQSILGRNADGDYWQNELLDGDIVMSSIHDAILAAISEPEDVVEEIYNRLFGHSADSAGLAYWMGELASGGVSISGLESALIAGAQGSDLEYYNENKGKVEITNWKDFETAAGLLGLNADNYYNEITSTRTGEFSTSEEEVEAALSLLNDLPDIIDSSGNLISSALDEIVNTIGTMDSAVLEDIFGSSAADQINALVSAISNYESSLESDSDTSEGSYGTDTDETQSQIDAIYAQIQEGLDTINLSDFEQEIYDITKQSQEWTDSLSELGVTSAEDLAIIDEWVAAQRQALVDAFSDDWQDIINENTLSDTSLELLDLEEWYEEQKAAAEELGMSLDDLTQAYDLQKESINEARQAEIDAFNESIQDIINENTLSDTDLNLLDLAEWYAEQTAAADELGLSLDTLTEAYDLQKEAIESARQSEVDSLLESSLDYLSKSGLSDFDSTMLDLEKEAASLTDQLTELNATESELSTITEWLAENEKELIQARQAEIDSLLESASDYLEKSGMSDFESEMYDLRKEAESLTQQLTELNATESELAVVTEWLSLKEHELIDARQEEIDSLLSSANDYLSKSGLSEFESQMLDLNNEADSLTNQLIELNATNEELAVVTEWLSAKEQELIDARQAEIDAFNKSIQDIISKNTLSDLEYELKNLTSWYDEQKASAEGLGVALDAVNEAYELQKKAAYESAITTARSSYIESLQAEQSTLEDALSIAKENYINGLNDEITALNETAAEAEKTAESFESLLETIKELKYSSVTDSELNPDKQMAFVGAELAAAMAKIQSGDTAEIKSGMEDLPTLTADFLELSKQTSGSFGSYQNDFAYVMRILNEAEQIAGDQKSTAELSLDELTAQTESLEATLNAVNGIDETLGTLEELEAAYNAAKSNLDNSWYQDEIDRLTEINSSVLSLTEAQSNYFSLLTAAITAGFSEYQGELELATSAAGVSSTQYSSTGTAGAAGTQGTNIIEPDWWEGSAYQKEYGDKYSMVLGSHDWSDPYTDGMTMSDYWGERAKTAKFADGGTVSGPDSGYFMPTTFHGIEHITPDSEMTEVKEVLGEVKDILISIRDTGGNVNKLTIQTNRLLDRVTQGGTEMRVKEIA